MNVKPWYEQEEFWETLYPFEAPGKSWDLAITDVDQLLSLVNLAPGSTVLDLPCGPGRHSLELTRRGFRVTGVDRTARYLERARQSADGEGLSIEWVESDMREFCRPDAFDATLNLFTSFGYFEDPADDRVVASNFLRSLRGGGVLIMDLIGKEKLARIFTERDWSEDPDGTITLNERKIHSGWDWIENRRILLRGTERREFHFSHRIYSAVELSQLLTDCGFVSVEVYGDLEGSPYDHTARRLVVVARKG